MNKMKECPNIESNKERCTCDHKDCPRYGMCCECIAFHKKLGQKPHCLL